MVTNVAGSAPASPYRTKAEQAKGAMDQLVGSALNVMGGEDEIVEAMADSLFNQHRTLQASFWRAIQKLAVQYGAEARTDLRNEGAKEFAQKVGAIEAYIPHV